MKKENNKKEVKISYKKIWNIFGNTILILLILIGVLIGYSLLPIKNNYKIYSVMSGSMAPTIPTGGLVLVKPLTEYKISDIITYKQLGSTRKNDTVTHRIVEQKKEDNGTSYFVTKGDANNAPDEEKVTADLIIGKTIFSIALLGYIIGYIKTLPGLILIILIPAVIIIYEEVKKIHREAKQIIAKKREVKEFAKKETERKDSVAKKVLDKQQKGKKTIKKRRKNVKKT